MHITPPSVTDPCNKAPCSISLFTHNTQPEEDRLEVMLHARGRHRIQKEKLTHTCLILQRQFPHAKHGWASDLVRGTLLWQKGGRIICNILLSRTFCSTGGDSRSCHMCDTPPLFSPSISFRRGWDKMHLQKGSFWTSWSTFCFCVFSELLVFWTLSMCVLVGQGETKCPPPPLQGQTKLFSPVSMAN